ncbi:unnamed protein product, partial [Laminaria digitata]
VGTYNPLATRSGVKEVTFKVDRIRYWVSVGAQPSDRVAWLLGQFGILPPKVVPVARTKQTVPRKEWKELKKQQEQGGGGKSLHTLATRLAAFEPFGGANGASSPPAKPVSPLAISPATVSSAPLNCEKAGVVTAAAPQSSHLSGFHEWPRGFLGWAAGGGGTLNNSPPPAGSSRVSAGAVGGASVGVSGEHRCLEGLGVVVVTPSSSSVEDSPLRAALASHLSQLGPAACARLGCHPREEEARRDRG